MKCEQARLMLTAYRELKNGKVDTTELDVHLEHCAACRQFLANSTFVGASLRALPALEPPPAMHAQLMRRLAREHLQFMQKAAPGSIPTPPFLKPYLQEHTQSTPASHPIHALATAETGPLPIIHARRKGRPSAPHARRLPLNQFAILGLAAAVLMLLMMGGVTSLVFLAQHNAQQLAGVTSKTSESIHHVDINASLYTTATQYSHIVSAVADSDAIYYTAYSDSAPSQWMLLEMSRTQEISSPLLTNPGGQPMIVLGSSSDWLAWLQYGTPETKTYRNSPTGHAHAVVTPWSLYALSLTQLRDNQQTGDALPTPQPLLSGSFDQSTAPTWVHNPVQSTWFMQDTLLITALDSNGTSHLFSSQLNLAGKSTLTTLATAAPGHIFTSPTADSTGTIVYWADEWISDDGSLDSNIWQQRQVNAPGATRPTHGHWVDAVPQTPQQQLFRADGFSFHPQIADDTLFWINAAPQSTASETPTPTPVATPGVPRADTAFSAPPLDTTIHGQILMKPVTDDTLMQPVALTSTGQAYALQIGTDFALWQTDKGYQMYDVPTQGNVTVGAILNDASFLAVNTTTAVWITDTADNPPGTTSGSTPTVHIFAFDWPK